MPLGVIRVYLVLERGLAILAKENRALDFVSLLPTSFYFKSKHNKVVADDCEDFVAREPLAKTMSADFVLMLLENTGD